MLLSFIIATFKNNHSLSKVVDTLFQHGEKRNVQFEILVVDNSPTDEYIEHLKQKQSEKLKIFKNPKLGAHYSRVLGLNQSKGSLIVVVDDDNYITEKYFDFLIQQSERQNENLFIGCVTKEYQFIDWEKAEVNPECYACGSIDKNGYRGMPIFWGAGMAMSRPLAIKIFSIEMIVEGRKPKRKYIMSGEDTEISFRALLHNAIFIYYEDIGLLHDININRVNKEYYKKLMIGLSFASWLLRPYHFVRTGKLVVKNHYYWTIFNMGCALAYFILHPFKMDAHLIVKDAFLFSEKKRQYKIVSNYK